MKKGWKIILDRIRKGWDIFSMNKSKLSIIFKRKRKTIKKNRINKAEGYLTKLNRYSNIVEFYVEF